MRLLKWSVFGVSASRLTNVTALLGRLNETLWKSSQPEQSRPSRAKPMQTGSPLFSPHCWSSEGWLPFCPGWQSKSEEVVNAKAHEAVKTGHTIERFHCRLTESSRSSWDNKPKDTDLFVLYKGCYNRKDKIYSLLSSREQCDVFLAHASRMISL